MSLVKLVNNRCTDKNTRHSYLDLYEQLLVSKKFTAKNVLEVGIGPWGGGSIKLWADYFVDANVHAIDIFGIDQIPNHIKTNPKIILYLKSNAYNKEFVKTNS